MGDEEAKLNRPRFRSLSKWSKGSKEDKDDSFKLNEDVVSFLKPSTDKATMRPKLNLAIAQRFPDPQNVADEVSQDEPMVETGPRKKRRREGLKVGFVETAPDIMGEGGDECPDAPEEIGKRRQRLVGGSHMQPVQQTQSQSRTNVPQQSWPLPMQSQNQTQPPDREPRLPSIVMDSPTQMPPPIQQRMFTPTQIEYANSPVSMHAQRLRVMASSEGMSFKRASSIINENEKAILGSDDDNDSDDDDPPPHFGPTKQPLSLPVRLPEVKTSKNDGLLPPVQALSAITPITPQGPSPFDDPKYTKHYDDKRQQAEQAQPNAAKQYPGQATYTPYQQKRAPPTAFDRMKTSGFSASQTSITKTDSAGSKSNHSPFSAFQPEPSRPGSSAGAQPAARNDQNDAALRDFARRVAHMHGVFELTAEKERPAAKCSPESWLRSAYWWYLQGKTALGSAVQQRQRSQEVPREILLQGHVDLAKAWWILDEPLRHYSQPASSPSPLHIGYASLHKHLRSLCASIGQSKIMPPASSLIQGQDTRIWLGHPGLDSTSAGQLRKVLATVNRREDVILDAESAFPLSDSRSLFCYTRFMVSVIAQTQPLAHLPLLAMLTVVRRADSYENTIIISSQDDFVNIVIGSFDGAQLGWMHVSWQQESCSLMVMPNQGPSLEIRLDEKDFGSLRRMIDYTRRVARMSHAGRDETCKEAINLHTLEYRDAYPKALLFPQGPVEHCKLYLFQQDHDQRTSAAPRFRVVLTTDVSVKTVSCVGHDIDHECLSSFHNSCDGQDSVKALMALPARDGRSVASLEFNNARDLQALRNALSETTATQDTVFSSDLVSFNIKPALDNSAFQELMENRSWQSIDVMYSVADSADQNVDTERLKIVTRHLEAECSDAIYVGKGEVMIRLPTDYSTTMYIYRWPQPNFHVDSTLQELVAFEEVAAASSTVRAYRFTHMAELHAFEAALTGVSVLYDGIAHTFAISRRKTLVPIHHKWTTQQVRLQVVSTNKKTVVQIVAFMENFEHSEAMCFQVKATDMIEKSKGDAKGKDWSVKLHDANFSLQPQAPVSKENPVIDIRSKFVNLDALEYPDQKDDISIGFESERDRELFAQVLPATNKVGRMMTLRRKK